MHVAIAPPARALAGLALVATVVLGSAAPSQATDASPSPSPSSPSGSATPGTSDGQQASFSIQPYQAKDAGARGIFSYNATPGGLVHDKATITNNGPVPLTLRIVTADALNTTEGAFGVTASDVKPVDTGSWISIPKRYREVRLPARTGQKPPTLTISFTVRIPADATPGDHVGAVLAVLDTKGTNTSGPVINLEQRVGSRVFVRVVGDLRPELTVSNVHASYAQSWNPFASGSATITYTVTNTGNIGLGGLPGATVEPWVGPTAAGSGDAINLLLPGSSVTRTQEVNGVWPLFHELATVNVTPLLIPGSVQPDTTVVPGTASFWAIPWVWLVILVVVLGVAIYLRRRRTLTAPGLPPESGGGAGPDGGSTDPSPTPKAVSLT